MEWVIYASAVILHIWAVISLISLYILFQYLSVIPKANIADVKFYRVRVSLPFIGLIFFYSWVFFG